MQAVILAGGAGARLGKLTKNLPKPLVKIGSKSVLEHQIILLRSFGIKDIFILTGFKGEKIHQALGNGQKLGVKIRYDHGPVEWNTADRVMHAKKYIKNDFLLLYGDVMINFDLKKFIKFHKSNHKNQLATLVIHPNNHPLHSDVVELGSDNKIKAFHPKPHPENVYFRNLVNAGVYIMSPKIFPILKRHPGSDFGRTIFPYIVASKKTLLAYNSTEYFRDMGTPELLEQVTRDYKAGVYKKGSLTFKRQAVFLDRDGVLNEEVNQLSSPKDLHVYPFSAKALKLFNQAGCLVVVVTNQPQIARGYITEQDLRLIHNKLEWELGKHGAKIDAIYYCPHHVIDATVVRPVKKYAIECNCRKPKPGLIYRAAKDLNIDLKKSFFVGDSFRDSEVAKNAKLKFLGVATGYGCKDASLNTGREPEIYKNLLVLVKKMFKYPKR